MYYVENTRYNYTRTIGSCVLRKECKNVIAKELEYMQQKGITKPGEFYIRNEQGERQKMRIKHNKQTWDKKERATTDYGTEIEYRK